MFLLCHSHAMPISSFPPKAVELTTLTPRQWCVVVNPAEIVQDHVCSSLGKRELRRGPCSFFLQPGEELEGESGFHDIFL